MRGLALLLISSALLIASAPCFSFTRHFFAQRFFAVPPHSKLFLHLALLLRNNSNLFRRRAVPCSSDLCLSESRLFHSLATQLIASPFHRLAFPGSSLPILRISRPVLAMPLLYLSARLPARLCYATAILISPAHCLSFLPRPRQHNPRGNYPLKSYASLRYRCIFRNPATPQ